MNENGARENDGADPVQAQMDSMSVALPARPQSTVRSASHAPPDDIGVRKKNITAYADYPHITAQL